MHKLYYKRTETELKAEPTVSFVDRRRIVVKRLVMKYLESVMHARSAVGLLFVLCKVTYMLFSLQQFRSYVPTVKHSVKLRDCYASFVMTVSIHARYAFFFQRPCCGNQFERTVILLAFQNI
jgi:hypothetical protein